MSPPPIFGEALAIEQMASEENDDEDIWISCVGIDDMDEDEDDGGDDFVVEDEEVEDED
jgi:hypothetical protein